MARRRLTAETLDSANQYRSACENVKLAETILGRAASDREVLDTARVIAQLSPDSVAKINQRRQAVVQGVQRLGADGVAGDEDPWNEPGPEQPDPTNNQAYVKRIDTTPDHAGLETFQKKSIHAPTASRRKARDVEPDEPVIDDELDDEEDDELDDDDEAEDFDDAHEDDEEEFDDDELDDEEDGEDEFDDEADAVNDDDVRMEDGAEFNDGIEDDDFEGEHNEDNFDLDEGDPGLDSMMDDDDGMDEFSHEDVLEYAPHQHKKSSRRSAKSKRSLNFTLDDLLSSDADPSSMIASASTVDEGDLDALTASAGHSRNRVDDGKRVATRRQRPEEYVWDNALDEEPAPRKTASKKKRPAVQRKAASQRRAAPVNQLPPDRRRIARKPNTHNEFDDVFNVPDVSKYFQ